MSNLDQSTLFFIIGIAFLVNLVVLFYIIRMAVQSANKDVVRQLRVLTYLKAEEMRQNGKTVDAAVITDAVNEVDHLYSRKPNMSTSQFLKEKEKHLI